MNNFTIFGIKSKIMDAFLLLSFVNYYPDFPDSICTEMSIIREEPLDDWSISFINLEDDI